MTRVFDASAGMVIDVSLPAGTMTTREVWSDGHVHRYERTATGDWLWCERCQCYVSNQCDHRTRLCRTSR